jgi:uncharacterized damage-inducible protein DinB
MALLQNQTMDRFNKFYYRELNSLKVELQAFESEETLWQTLPGIKNSAGNISLHIIGNLQHFIGHVLGKSSYMRDRDAEFTLQHVPLTKILKDIEETAQMIDKVLPALKDADLKMEFPIKLNNQTYLTEDFLQHLLIHLSYHLGQVTYLRRILQATH